jgi:hypothetical protein
MDIVVWLRSLSLERYEAAFRENEIDGTVLPGLTAEDLKELGVAALGHRRKLLDAIAALRADASGKPPSADVATMSTTPSASPEDRAERRQVTVMFSQPDVARAEACFERALSVARMQQAKSWELRASMSLARLWRDQGKVQQARELLAPVYGWFTKGFDTRDLKEAKALLEELAA